MNVWNGINRTADRVVGVFSPAAALKRQALRKRVELVAKYGAGMQSRIHGGWDPGGGSANSQVLDDLPTARQRCRDAAVNDAIYLALREVMVLHVIGRNGLVPKSVIDADRLGISTDQAEEWQGTVDDLWKRRSPHADVTGRCTSWAGFLRLAFRSMFDGGDVFCGFPTADWPEVGETFTRCNLVEAERVSTPPAYADDERVHGGVRTTKWGAPTTFYVTRGYPGDMHAKLDRSRKWERWFRYRNVPGESGPLAQRLNFLQLLHPERVGQGRGLPRLGTVLDWIDQLSDYVDSTIIGARVATRLSYWIQTAADPDDVADALGGDWSDPGTSMQRARDGIESGSVNILAPGDDVKTVAANTPSQYFDQLVQRMLRTIAAPLKVPISVAFLDQAGLTYSGLRGQLTAFGGTIRQEQDVLMPLCEAFWNHLLTDAWLAGELPDFANFDEVPHLWTNATWSAPVLGPIDPTKDTKADVESMNAGIRTLRQIVEGRGDSYAEHLLSLRQEQEDLKDLRIGKKVYETVTVEDGDEAEDDEEMPEPDEEAPATEEETVETTR